MSSLTELAKPIIATIEGIEESMISTDVIDTEDWDGTTKIVLTEQVQNVNQCQSGATSANMYLQVACLAANPDEAKRIARLAGNVVEAAWKNMNAAADGVYSILLESEQQQTDSVSSREEFSVSRLYQVIANVRL